MPAVHDLLEVDDLSVSGPGDFIARLPSLRLAQGGRAALFGPSGSGKSTLLDALFGLLHRPGWQLGGGVRLRGRELRFLTGDEWRHLRRHDLAFLQQDAHAALDPLVAIGAQIEQATGAGPDRVQAMLGQLGVDDPAGVAARQPHRISGGQAQRALLAIAFLRRPALVVADEPSASLDGGSYAELRAQLGALLDAGSALLVATHDHRLLRDLGTDTYVLRDGSFVRAAPDERPWPRCSPAAQGNLPLLTAEAVRVAYGARVVLDDVDLVLHRGEVVALVGESGAGKTTLLRVLAGHQRPDRGVVRRPERRTAVQLVCQDAYASLTPRRTLGSLLQEARAPFFDPAAGAGAVHLPEAVLQRTAAAMSGGERRRAALLRALAVQPDVLLLDEPTASLDRVAAITLIENLLTMQRSRALGMLLVTHDEDLAQAVAHRTLEVRGGKLWQN